MNSILEDPRLDWSLLKRYHFNEAAFMEYHSRITSGDLVAQSAVFTGTIEPVLNIPEIDWADKEYEQAGRTALMNGEVAVLVLNGGMATRFGNVVKGTVPVFDDLSFLELKAADVQEASNTFGSTVPFIMMNSFATSKQTQEHVELKNRYGLDDNQILSFEQSISIRMMQDGSLFVGQDGLPSYHAPGHGDFLSCIRQSGVLDALQQRGVKYLLFSNVDNLGATVEPHIIGQHICSKAEMSAEVTERRKTASGQWDKGGAPAIADGRKQLLEGFRFPPEFDPSTFPDFSTNNFLFNLAAIDRELPLPRHVVEKNINGKTALQLEAITCEVSGIYDEHDKPLLTLNLIRVPRDGTRGRFFPVKERADLEAMRELLKNRLHSGWEARRLRTD